MLFGKVEQYALCAEEKKAVFVHMQKGQNSLMQVRLLASSNLIDGKTIDASSLVAGGGRKKGNVALILPLGSFEVINVSVPAVSHEAIGRMLPFNLAKVLNAPITDYIYDWQVAQKFKDRFELTVYLYSLSEYNRMRQDLLSRQKEICWFEPDVFSAASYLDSVNPGWLKTTGLILLVWENTISFCVCENDRVALVRTVELEKPQKGTPAQESREQREVEQENLNLEEEHVPELLLAEDEGERKDDPFDFGETHSILEGFNLQQDDTNEDNNSDELPSHNEGDKAERELSWTEYMQALSLEVMRTADYHTSVLKGQPIKNIVVGGAEQFFNEFEKLVQESMKVEMSPFPAENVDGDIDQTMAALCIGALSR